MTDGMRLAILATQVPILLMVMREPGLISYFADAAAVLMTAVAISIIVSRWRRAMKREP